LLAIEKVTGVEAVRTEVPAGGRFACFTESWQLDEALEAAVRSVVPAPTWRIAAKPTVNLCALWPNIGTTRLISIRQPTTDGNGFVLICASTTRWFCRPSKPERLSRTSLANDTSANNGKLSILIL